MVGELRDSLHTSMGVRQFRVYLCTKTWDSGRRGEGVATVTEVEIVPQPNVDMDGLGYELRAGGKREEGTVLLTEVDLTYTEDELTGQPVGSGDEFYYRIADAQGQSIADRTFVLSEPPKPDRVKTIGWIIKLRSQGGC